MLRLNKLISVSRDSDDKLLLNRYVVLCLYLDQYDSNSLFFDCFYCLICNGCHTCRVLP